MSPMHREWARRALVCFERGELEDANMYFTGFVSGYTDTLTPTIVDALVREDYVTVCALVRRQIHE